MHGDGGRSAERLGDGPLLLPEPGVALRDEQWESAIGGAAGAGGGAELYVRRVEPAADGGGGGRMVADV